MTYKQTLFTIVLFSLLSSCEEEITAIDSTTNRAEYQQTLNPILSGFPQEGEIIDTTRQLESIYHPVLVSKKDTAYFTKDFLFDEYNRRSDTVPYSNAQNIKIYVDTNQQFAEKYRQIIPIEHTIAEVDSNGNIIPGDPYEMPYDTVMKTAVFLINESDSAVRLEHHDHKLVIIQEALNRNNEWTPIEYFHFTGCGNSYGEYIIDPDEFMLFGVRKYTGNFKTKFRIRLADGDSIYFSNEFDGRLNEGQFDKFEREWTYAWNQYLVEGGF